MAEPLIDEYQANFKKESGTPELIFIMKKILVIYYEYKVPALILFMGFEKAYDSINRENLVKVISEWIEHVA